MSPTSYQAAPLRDIDGARDRNRTGTGVKSRRILSPVRLPVPPLERMFPAKRLTILLFTASGKVFSESINYYITGKRVCQDIFAKTYVDIVTDIYYNI